MKDNPKAYRRLPGRGGNLVGYHSLWAGPDHLLGVFETLSTESYRRFYYRDIQAVVVRRTITGPLINAVLGILTLLFVLPAATAGFPGHLAAWISGGTTLLLLATNWLLGPTCTCHLQTAVQVEKLPSLKRVRTVRRVLARLRPRIEAVQGRLAPDALRGRLDTVPSETAPTGRSRREAARPPRVVSPSLHIWLFGLLIGLGLVSAADGALAHPLPSLLAIVVFAATVPVSIAALVRQAGSTLGRGLKTVTWLSLGFLAVGFVASNVMYMVLILQNPRILTMGQWHMFTQFARFSPLEHPLLLADFIFSVGGALSLGLAGLRYARRAGDRRGNSG